MPTLTAPIWHVTLSDYVVTRLHQFEVVTSRSTPVDTVRLRIPQSALPALAPATRLNVYQGYRSTGVWSIFDGTVRRIETRGDEVTIHGSDPMAPVVATPVSRSFTGATPQEILRWALAQAGVTQFRFTMRRYPALPRFVADGPIGRVINAVGQAWGIANEMYWLPDEGVWWGPPEESPRAQNTPPIIVYGQNLLSHTVEAGGTRGRLVIEPIPVYHSNMILVEDPRAWAGQRRLRVDRVIHQARPARTVIEWSTPEAS